MSESPDAKFRAEERLRMAAEIVSAYVSRNAVSSDQVSGLIRSVHAVLAGLDGDAMAAPEAAERHPAVPIRKSVTANFIVCLEDGKKLKMLKRHLRTAYGMSPEEYRAKWGLPSDYPMVAPNYAAQRSAFARKIGLGRKGKKGPSRSRS